MNKTKFKTLEEVKLHAIENFEGKWTDYYYDKYRYDGLIERYTYRWRENKMEFAGSMYKFYICSNCKKSYSAGLFHEDLARSFCVYCGYDRSKPTKPEIDSEYVHITYEESEK